ncbi:MULTISPECIES: class I SAM-dependent methyltransferase [unclassified Streptomyces]|uniref:class I SAM-dependent methyltransferase n=1 Tax=unclassified Streptomyces TaxID=2593676 RepID=UPI000DD84CF6|nr:MULTISPECIES: class I SAM-dependent methyltransferase [unclassified Streptomyces]QZZ28703.1 class I SAM-dependent methyltransferase [Streptomyces sp. ST1015]
MSAEVQEAFLRGFHAGRPGVTGEAFARGRGPDGRSSYELLRDRVSGARRVLDLGCGDGVLLELLRDGSPGRRLAGMDLSPEAVRLARARGFDVEVGRAQELPYADGEFDAVVSHMAFMLMADVETVAAEVARVLAPGGVFACVLGGGAVGGEAYERFVQVLRRLPAGGIPALGDRRVRDREGVEAVLCGAGFGEVTWESVAIDIGGSLAEVWESLAGVYDLGPLSAGQVEGVRREFLGAVGDLVGEDGRVPCGFVVRVVGGVSLSPTSV